MNERHVFVQDARAWLRASPVLTGSSLVTSLPDISEFPTFSVADWKAWFLETAQEVFSKVPEEGVAIFFQSDVKKNGAWVDKGYLAQRAAELAGFETLWHKIVCRKPAGTVTFGRPAYSHLLCFSKGVRLDMSKASADVLPDAGATTWTRGMGTEACRIACKFILEQTRTRTVVNPFCGHGTVLAVANAMGLDAVGIELSPKRAKKAKALRFPDWT